MGQYGFPFVETATIVTVRKYLMLQISHKALCDKSLDSFAVTGISVCQLLIQTIFQPDSVFDKGVPSVDKL